MFHQNQSQSERDREKLYKHVRELDEIIHQLTMLRNEYKGISKREVIEFEDHKYFRTLDIRGGVLIDTHGNDHPFKIMVNFKGGDN